MNGQKIDGQEVQVSLAKPPSNKHEISSQPNSKLRKIFDSFIKLLVSVNIPKFIVHCKM